MKPPWKSEMAAPIMSIADLLVSLGNVPASRVRWHPTPGTATEEDLLTACGGAGDHHFELVEGTLVERAMGSPEGLLAAALIGLLREFSQSHRPGIVLSADAFFRMIGGNVRSPDVSYFARDRLPGGKLPRGQITSLAPDLAIEVLSPSNSDDEMSMKRREYFARGTLLVWEVDPRSQLVRVYSSPEEADVTLSTSDTLTGGQVLPGFSLPLAELFSELDVFE